MTSYRVIFQDRGIDSRRSDTTYIRVRIWEGDRYVGAWFGLLNGRSRRRYLTDQEQTDQYEAMAPLMLALAIRDAVEGGEFNAPRDVPLHPSEVLQLPPEARQWSTGDEVMAFDV
jgi:hypothetical protein